MPWFKVDDSFHSHPKVMSIPRGAPRLRAVGLWTALGSWCADQLTDGHVPAHMIAEKGGTTRDATALVTAQLWHRVDGGYQFHDWQDWQPTRAKVEADRADARDRMAKARAARRENNTNVRAHTPRTSESVRSTPTRPDPTYAAAAASGDPTPPQPPPLPDAVEILRTRLDAARLVVRWDRLDATQLEEITTLIDVHGDSALVKAALTAHRPDAPAAFAQAWLGTWRTLTPPGAGLRLVADEPCTAPGHQGTARHCVQCASERKAAR